MQSPGSIVFTRSYSAIGHRRLAIEEARLELMFRKPKLRKKGWQALWRRMQNISAEQTAIRLAPDQDPPSE
jgi:hypothetical protein